MQRFSLRRPDEEDDILNLLGGDMLSDVSDKDLLPKIEAYKRPQMKEKDYLKLYMA